MNTEQEDELDGMDQQRRALEEMSQNLLDKLNAMVKEQEQRAREFAERTHSLSSLPEAYREQMPSLRDVEPLVRNVREGVTEKVRKDLPEVPPLVRRAVQMEKPAKVVQRAVKTVMEGRSAPKPAKDDSKNVGCFIIAVFVLFVIIRSCS